MFPNKGHFSKTSCPFFKTGHCERPHCHYAHFKQSVSKLASEKTTNDTKPSSQVPEYIPTPTAKKKEDTSEASCSKLNGSIGDPKEYKLTEGLLKSKPAKTKVPEYIPTPREELKKRKLSQTSDNSDDCLVLNGPSKSDSNGNSKKRIAHSQAGPSTSSSTSTSACKKLNARAMMEKRFDAAKITESEKVFDPLATNKNKKRLAHCVKKEYKCDNNKTSAGRPSLLFERGSKIPVALRQRYLDQLVDEFLKSIDPEDAYEQAKTMEREAYSRTTVSKIYMNLIVSKIKTIRNALNPSAKPVTASKSISHEAVLNGKIHGKFTKINKSYIAVDSLSPDVLHGHLLKYVMSPEKLKIYGYPLVDHTNKSHAILPPIEQGRKMNDFHTKYRVCSRCKKSFVVDDQGVPVREETCIYHSGRIWTERFNRSLEKIYSCCRQDQLAGGCCSDKSHVVDGYGHPLHNRGFVCTQEKPVSNGNYGIYALDCEMVYTTIGFELTRVSVIDHKYRPVYEKMVRPANPILDFNTKFSGITADDLVGVTCSLQDVQQDLLEIFNSKTILMGHSLESDMKALKMIHSTIIDTSEIFPHKRGLPFKRALRTLMSEVMHQIIQDSVEGHDSSEDAKSVMQLMLAKLEQDLKRLSR